jgi:hypothetical protein
MLKRLILYLAIFIFLPKLIFAQTTTTTTTTNSTGTTTKTETGTTPAVAPAANPPQPAVTPATILLLPVINTAPTPPAPSQAANTQGQQPSAGQTPAANNSNASQTSNAQPQQASNTQQTQTATQAQPAAQNTTAGGQNASNIGYQRYSRIKIDFTKGVFDPYTIPFDVPFVVYGPVTKEIKRMVLFYYEGKNAPAFPNDVNVNGTVTTSASGAANGSATPLNVHGINEQGNVAYGGTISRNGQVNIVGNVGPYDSKKMGLLEWKRNYLNTSTAASTQDNFYFIVPPLNAIKKYTFEFIVYREVSQTESSDLNTLLKPIVIKHFKNLINAGMTANDVFTAFQAPSAEKDDLLVELAKNIHDYYHYRDIEMPEDEIKGMLSSGLTNYIQNYFITTLNDKNTIYQKYVLSRADALTETHAILTDPVLNYIPTNFKAFDIKDLDLGFFQTVLLSAPDFVNLVIGQIGANPIDGSFTALQLEANLKVQVDFITKINNLYVDLLSIKNDQTKSKILTDAHLDINTTIQHVKNLLDKLKTNFGNINDFNDVNLKLDIAYANATFDFKGAFPLTITVPGKTTADFVTRGEWYITADLGFAFVKLHPTNSLKPYLGVNFNLFPINRQADYSIAHAISSGHPSDILKGISIVTGLSVTGFGSTDKYNDLFGNTSLLTGIGIRITDGVRITYGRFWAYQKSVNPLLNNTRLITDPYISLSLDWDLRSWLKSFGKNITGFNN